jgi:hypothetical protein
MSEIYLYHNDVKKLKKEIKYSKKYIKTHKLLPNFIHKNTYIVIHDDENIKYKVLITYNDFEYFSKMTFQQFITFSIKHIKKISYKELNGLDNLIPFNEYKIYLKNHPVILDYEKSIDLLLFLFKVDSSKFMFEQKVLKFIEICELSDIVGVDETLLDYEKRYFFKNYIYSEGMLN